MTRSRPTELGLLFLAAVGLALAAVLALSFSARTGGASTRPARGPGGSCPGGRGAGCRRRNRVGRDEGDPDVSFQPLRRRQHHLPEIAVRLW